MKHPVNLQANCHEAGADGLKNFEPAKKHKGKVIPIFPEKKSALRKRMTKKEIPLFFEYRFRAKDNDPL